jgi:serpin B
MNRSRQAKDPSIMRSRFVSLIAPLLMFACSDATAPGPESPPSAASQATPQPGASTAASNASSIATAPTASAKPPAPAPKPDEIESAARYAKANNAFGFDIYNEIRKEPGNLAMSPTSLSIALAMTWAGAAGDTSAEMRKVLHFQSSPNDVLADASKLIKLLENPSQPLKLSFANRLFGEKTYTFEKAYLDATDKAFGAGLEAVDFRQAADKSRETINAWVEKKTEKRITELIPGGALDKDTRLVLVNAVYFLADWQRPFDKARTQPDDFSVSASNKVRAQMMRQEASFNFAESGGAKLLELPYKGGEMSMLLALPNEADGIGKLEQSLTPEKLAEWTKALKNEHVSVALPKFEVNPAKSTKLDDALKKLGMKLAFDNKKADFTAMAKPPNPAEQLVVSHVFHKAFVKVDEKGTEAAAASAVAMSVKGAAAKPAAEFKADHPFVYFIRDNKSGLVLFMGRVADPTAK